MMSSGLNTINDNQNQTRSSRNAKLYKQVYGSYDDLENLPLEDNTNEIDMAKLRELVLNNNIEKDKEALKDNLNILEQRKRRIDEQKLYDINKILEKAKYENNKLKETTSNIKKPKTDLLATLKSTELSLDEINEAKAKYQEILRREENKLDEEDNDSYDKDNLSITKEEELSITREMKYKDLSESIKEETKNEEETKYNTNNLSLDLFEDLKPTGNTIITKPITSDLMNKIDTSKIESDIHSGDTRDIDIIKDVSYTKEKESDFFTNAYEFSKSDFSDEEEDFFDTPKKGGLFKILLLVLAIFIFVGAIIYFIGTYGIGL